MNSLAQVASASERGPIPAAQANLRERLGIPKDARRVLVFTESSHWDTNWLQTSEEYLRSRIEPILFTVLSALEEDPLRVYCIESVFFLRLFWQRHPEARDRLCALLEPTRDRPPQLRILSSSLTTADTLLPHPEAILRDFHLGQEWLRQQGISAYPTTAYFPDNFGHSPHLPSLMRAVGVDSVGVTRIDGMYFVASDFRAEREYPLRGSTAEVLQKQLRTLDFIWRDDDGAEVLCHWNAFTYFQGDMLAHAGIIRWAGHAAAIPWRTRSHIARRIDGFVRRLEPLARTPYLLCPIGMDFNDPITGLRTLLERYNRERYGDTGTWTVLAGLDDHFALLGEHKGDLPVLSVDPNPYWMGFYASRPELKQRPTRIVRRLILAEKLSALESPDAELDASLHEGWSKVVLMNHHDAITGTSPDRVSHAEQKAWLDDADAAAHDALRRVSGRVRPVPPSPPPAADVQWKRDGSSLRVTTPHYTLCFSQARGWALTSFVALGKEQLMGVGFDLVVYSDEGGLWRLGHEYRGGGFTERDRASLRPAKMDVVTIEGGIAVVVQCDLRGKRFTREVTCRGDDPLVRFRVEGTVARRQTVTCRFEMTDGPVGLRMDTIGGSIERPRERGHSPTFWPVPSTLSLRGPTHALHSAFEAPSAVSFSPQHALEWIVARNSTKERAFGLLPVLAHPIGGTDDAVQTHQAAMFVTSGPVGHPIPPELRRRLELAWLPDEVHAVKRWARTLVQCSDAEVSFSAIKRADVGDGVIVRLVHEHPAGKNVRITIPGRNIRAAYLCDARERDLAALEVLGGGALVEIQRRLTTVRLLVDASDGGIPGALARTLAS
jgi:hypothetical protein